MMVSWAFNRFLKIFIPGGVDFLEELINPYSGSLKDLKKAPGAPTYCPICDKQVVRRKDEYRGEYVCEECGLVLGRILVYGDREILFGEGDDPDL